MHAPTPAYPGGSARADRLIGLESTNMFLVNCVAEVKYIDSEISIFGVIQKGDPQRLALCLLTLPTCREAFLPGTTVEVAAKACEGNYGATGTILEEKDGLLSILLNEPLSKIEVYRIPRFRCDLPAIFRSTSFQGCATAWKNGTIVDISAGGARLHIDGTASIQTAVEVIIDLTSHEGKTAEGTVRRYSDDGTHIDHSQVDHKTIHAHARIAYCAAESDGSGIMGLSFTVMTPRDRNTLANFLNRLSA